MDKLQWTETLEVGDPVGFIAIKDAQSVLVIVERVTMQKVFLSNASSFFRRSSDLNSYPKITPWIPPKKDTLKSERKRKVLCQRLTRVNWNQLTLDQARAIHLYLKERKII